MTTTAAAARPRQSLAIGFTPCDAGVIRSGAPAAPRPLTLGRWVLAATILGSGMAFIDGTVVNVALPALQDAFGASIADVQWVVESYALTLAALMLTGGSLSDLLGRRRVFAAGIALFAVASAWCGVAPSVGQLVAARGVQGIGAALLVPGSLALISATFAEEQRGRAIGTWAGFTAITAAIGPVLGGWLIDTVSWRAIFFINLPIAAVVLGIVWRRVPADAPRRERAGLDWAGAALATLGLAGIVTGLIESGRLGFGHPLVAWSLAAGAVLLAAFVVTERRVRTPMVPPSLFRSATFAGANLLTLLLYAALGGALFFFPINLIQMQGYSAMEAGAAFLPFILLMFALSRWSGGLLDRYGARLPLIIGPLIAALGFALFSLPAVGGSYWTTFFPAVAVLGLGMAVSVAPLTTAVMSAVPDDRAGTASGINNAASRVASLLAVAGLGILLVHVFRWQLAAQLGQLDLPEGVRRQIEAQETQVGAIDVPDLLDSRTAEAVRGAIESAFVAGFRTVMWTAAALAVGSAILAALTIRLEGSRKG